MGDDKPDLDAAGKMLNAEDVQAANQRAELFHALGELAAAERDEAVRRVRELEARLQEAHRDIVLRAAAAEHWREEAQAFGERVRELEAVARVLIAGDGDRLAVNDAMYRLRVLLGEA